MWTVIFIGTTIFCGIGWLGRYVSCLSLLYYMKTKQYKLPDDDEQKECTAWVIKKLFKV